MADDHEEIAIIRNDVKHLTDLVKDGFAKGEKNFKGIHDRQDIANHRTNKNEKSIIKVEGRIAQVFYNMESLVTKEDCQKEQLKKSKWWNTKIFNFAMGVLIIIAAEVIMFKIRSS